jgi:hypothetical protein
LRERIFCFELDGKDALGFDTGLDAQAFAQAKMAQFITQQGLLVYPDGKTEPWKASGVTERKPDGDGQETMVIWGPAFSGERLDSLVRDRERKDYALDAVRRWIGAREKAGKDGAGFPGAAGAFIAGPAEASCPPGTVLFPPERLVKRCLEAEGNRAVAEAQRWVHPDLAGAESIAFSAAAMLYCVFCGAPPFCGDDAETLRQDIREGVFVPPELAAPGLDGDLAKLIGEALGPVKKGGEVKKRPSPETLGLLVGNPGSRDAASWFAPLSDEEEAKIRNEGEQYKKTRELTVKTRRFVIRNTAIIAGCAAAVLVVVLGIQGYFKHLAEMPTTRGMTPVQVAETYYGGFETMDHILMDACVTNKAGKEDINMVTNLFVISRVRQAYETMGESTIAASEWLESGAEATDRTVFGVTGLSLRTTEGDETDGEVSLRADYTLWLPASFTGEDEEPLPSPDEIMNGDPQPRPPKGMAFTDRLKIVFLKDAWRIAEIDRVRQ